MTRVSSLLVGFAVIAACSASPPAVRPAAAPAAEPSTPALAPNDRIRIAEAFRLGEAIGDQIWPAWTSAPFAVLLVTPEREFLIRHPRPSAEFTRIGYDSLLGSDVLVRERRYSPNLLATFPAVSGVSTIVVGQPKVTGKTSTEWVLTLLHEHFHQLQTSRLGYFARVDSLGLARGDHTGMWMLNYAFPYDSSAVQAAVAELAQQLDSALTSTSPDARTTHWRRARAARATLRAALSADDDRYLAFQMWQEGVARYTELEAARFAATNFTPSAAFSALPDFIPFSTAATRIEATIHTGLRAPLARDRRVMFYALGAATALVMDLERIEWKGGYFTGEMGLR